MIIIIPMAGRGRRFTNEGYQTPKPLIEVAGKPMIYYAWCSVKDILCSKLVFIALREHEEYFGVSEVLAKWIPVRHEIIFVDQVTEGQLCTILLASNLFIEGEGILVTASDTYIESQIGEEIMNEQYEGIISVFDLPGDQWSFAQIDDNGKVIKVSEKERISNHASTGIYYFSDAKEMEREALKMIEENDRTRGEFYIMPLYNRMIKKGAHLVLSHAQSMWDMGTPEAKNKFEIFLLNDRV
jgi:dTDP-glucose pyrophosphorylase